MRREDGFSTVFVCLLLGAVTMLLLCCLEAAAGFAAGSICESACRVAGSSVLSEYQTDLQERYGILAMWSYEGGLEELSRFYIEGNLTGIGLLVRPGLEAVSVSTEGFEGLNAECFAQQIDAMGLELLGADALQMAGFADALKALFQPEGADAAKEAASSLDGSSAEGNGGGDAADLKESYEDAMDPDLETEPGRDLQSVDKASLPSSLLGVRQSRSLLVNALNALAQDGLSVSAVLQARYVQEVCGDLLSPGTGTVLGLETEYVLFGHGSDEENERACKEALFKLRCGIDLARYLADEERLTRYAAEAAAFPMVPEPLCIALLAGIEAAAAAKSDVAVLQEGGRVPLPGVPSLGQRSLGYYRDYAFLLLLILPAQTRLARLMDVMQMNVAYVDGAAFSFRDSCYGFSLRAEFVKRSHAPIGGKEQRHGVVEQVHGYL